MDLQVNTCPVFLPATLLDQTAEHPFDLDVHLPEYYPDVQRVLKCTVQPNVRSVSVNGDRVTVEGNGTLRMVYAAEDKSVVVFEQSVPIQKTVHSPQELSRAAVRADARTDFVNCRASGQRRAGIHGVISLRVCAWRTEEQSVVCGGGSDLLQMKTQTLHALSLTGYGERVFAMSEVVELGSEDPSVERLLRTSAAVRVESTKAVKDKLLVKGEAEIEWMYLPAQGGVPLRMRHTMPVSQILETPGVSEDDAQDVTLAVQELLLTPKPDGSGEMRLVDIALRIRASVRCGAPVELDAVTDLYATGGELRTTWEQMQLRTPAETIRDTLSVRQTIELPGADISRILDVAVGEVMAEYVGKDDLAQANCTAALSVLYLDAQGEPMAAEAKAEFIYSKSLAVTCPQSDCEMQVQISSCKASAAQNGIELQMEALVCGTVYAVQDCRLLRAVQLAESQDTQQPPALTIYFADPGESVWDIARRYRTTMQAVLTENDLSGDTVPDKRMLVIPTVQSALDI